MPDIVRNRLESLFHLISQLSRGYKLGRTDKKLLESFSVLHCVTDESMKGPGTVGYRYTDFFFQTCVYAGSFTGQMSIVYNL